MPSIRAADAAAGAALLAVVCFLFRDAVFRGQVFYYRDIHLQWQPQVEAFVRSIASGSWPLWNPDRCFGQPLLANPNNQVLYPMTWLNLVIRPWTYYTVYVVSHFLFCGIGVYALGLRLGLSRPASLLAAVVWISSGPFLSLANLWNHLAGAAWMPWGVLASDVALGSRKATHVVLWGLAMAAPILAGSPESALLAAVVAAVCGWRHVDRGNPWGRHNQRVLLSTIAAATITVGVAAGQWLPALELVGRSARASLPPSMRAYWSIHPYDLAEVAFPVLLHDLPLRSDVRALLFEAREPFLDSLYLGMVSLGLVSAALLSGPRRAVAMGLALTALCGLALALGRHTPLYDVLQVLLPPLRSLRFPAKAVILTSFAWALLVGIGFDTLVRQDRKRLRSVLVAEAATAAVLALAGIGAWLLHYHGEEVGSVLLSREFTRRSFSMVFAPSAERLLAVAGLSAALLVTHLARGRTAPWYSTAVWLLTAADPIAAHKDLTPTASRVLFTFKPPALAYLNVEEERSRVYVYDYNDPGKGERYLGHARFISAVPKEAWRFPWAEAVGLRSYLYPSVIGNWGLESAYSGDSLALFPLDLNRLKWLLRSVEGTPTHLRLLRMAGVSRVVALHTQGFDDLTHLATLPTFFPEPMHVFSVPDPLPRTYAVEGVRVASAAASFAVLQDPTFDPAREIILPEGSPAPADPRFLGASRLLEWKPDSVRLDVEVDRDGYAVLLDGYDPGWRATLDGHETPVLRANLVFRAVRVPAGHHVVEYRYRPGSVAIGLSVSATTLVLGLAMTLGARSKPVAGTGS